MISFATMNSLTAEFLYFVKFFKHIQLATIENSNYNHLILLAQKRLTEFFVTSINRR